MNINMKKIDKDSGVPFHIQIKDEIIKFARQNDSTQALPKHEKLAHMFRNLDLRELALTPFSISNSGVSQS